MSEDLKVKVSELEKSLEKKEQELAQALDKVEDLEDNVLRLESLVPEGEPKESKKNGSSQDSKSAYDLEVKDKELRELKDKMGFLRKEKVQLQQELEKMAKERDPSKSSVIRIEEKKSPLDALVNDLQNKINKQRLLITKLKQQSVSADATELTEKLRERDEEIEKLKVSVNELGKKASQVSAIGGGKGEDSLSKSLTQELQTQLNKAKKQVETLQQKLDKYEKKGKKEKEKEPKEEAEGEEINLKENIDELKDEIGKKSKQIDELKSKISVLEQGVEKAPSKSVGGAPGGLTEELQDKLNKAKIQIKTLQDQLQQYKKGEAPTGGKPQQEVEDELRNQKEMLISLQQQIDEHKKTLESKEGELLKTKNDAVQSKIKCEDLENLIKIKDQKITELKTQIDTLSNQSKAQTLAQVEDSQTQLRIRELKSLVEDISKQNAQQRFELSQLRRI